MTASVNTVPSAPHAANALRMSGLPTGGFTTKESEYTLLVDVNKFRSKLVNIIGVICSFRPARKSHGTDYTASVVLCDATRSLLSTGLFVSFFRDTPKKLPDIRGEGDIMVLQNVKILKKNNTEEFYGVSNVKTTWIIVPSIGELIPRFSGTLHFFPQERDYCLGLRNWWAARGGSKGARGLAQDAEPEKKVIRQAVEIKEMEENGYYDVLVFVVKKFYTQNILSLYVTDYTENEKLYEYTAAEHEGFPPGKLILQCSLWDVNKRWATEHVKEGDFILLQNMKTKISHSGYLEASMRQFPTHPDRILVDKIAYNDRRLQALKGRRNRVAMEQNRAEQLQKNQRIIEPVEEHVAPTVTPHIVIRHENVPIVSIGEVLNAANGAPFVNKKYRVRCRVIDFMPNTVKEFAVRNTSHYRWQFAVLLADEQEASLAAIISDAEAIEFLGISAEDVHVEGFLETLQEKLFLFWGNLEEGGKESPWVEVCLKEYGARESPAQWPQRRWKIFDTMIN